MQYSLEFDIPKVPVCQVSPRSYNADITQQYKLRLNGRNLGEGERGTKNFFQIDMIDSQLNHRPDGSVEILGQNGYIVIKPDYAEKLKATYQKFLEAYPTRDSLKIAVNIELPQPLGTMVNEG